ncbi:MAG: histone H1 [Candidatus Neomarinimicrobiota bacterium]
MSKTSKLYDQLKGHFDSFEAEHEKNMGGNKAAGSRARKSIGEVKKLVTDYRKASVAGE